MWGMGGDWGDRGDWSDGVCVDIEGWEVKGSQGCMGRLDWGEEMGMGCGVEGSGFLFCGTHLSRN